METSYAGARGVHWVQRADINTLRFEDVLAGRNRQADRSFPFLASSVGLDTANVSNWYSSFNLRATLHQRPDGAGQLHHFAQRRYWKCGHQHVQQPGQHAAHGFL